jgi:predicted nucleotidyltransferase
MATKSASCGTHLCNNLTLSLTLSDIEAARQFHHRRETQRRAQRETERLTWLRRAHEAILQLAPAYSDIRRAYLFGSLVQPGRFRPDSDIDVAVECQNLETESAFWRALERVLQRDVDVRPYIGPIVDAVAAWGQLIYEREDADLNQ